MATMGKTANNNAWLLTIGKSNDTTYDGSSIAYKLNTSGTFADQNIVVSVPAGSAKTPTGSGASTSTSLSGTTLTVQRSVTPTVTAGWLSSGSGTAGTVTITGTVPTETKTASSSGDITPSANKLLTKVTVPAGSATPSATLTTSTTALSSTTEVGQQYFSVTPKATVSTAGWIASISNGSAVNYKVKTGSVAVPASSGASTSTTLNGTTITTVRSISPSVTSGWVSSGTSGNITTTATVPTPSTTPVFTQNGDFSAPNNVLWKTITINIEGGGGGSAAGIWNAQYAKDIESTSTTIWSLSEVNWPINEAHTKTYSLNNNVVSGNQVQLLLGAATKTGSDSSNPSLTIVLYNSSSAASQEIATTTYNELGVGGWISPVITVDNTYNQIRFIRTSSGGQYITGFNAPSLKKGVSFDDGFMPIVASSTATVAKDLSSYQYVAVKKGSVSGAGELGGAAVNWSDNVITLTKSHTPSVTSGWINSGTAGTMIMHGTLSAATVTANSPTITPSISSSYTSGSGYKISGSATTSVSVNTAGYISSSVGTKTSGTATVSGYVTQNSFAIGTAPSGATVTQLNANATYKLSSGYYPTDRYYKTPSGGITPTGTITISKQTGTDVTSYATANVQSAADIVTYFESIPVSAAGAVTVGGTATSGYYPVTQTISGAMDFQTGGWAESTYAFGKSIGVGAILASTTGAATTSTTATAAQTIGYNQQCTISAGYYASDRIIRNSVAAGTAGTPSASKDTASNYSISVTPSVTNATGYITGGTKTGTAVSVSPTDLGLTQKTSLSKSGGTVSLAAGSYNTSALSATVSRSDLGITDKAAATYNPSTSAQTISSGYYLTGTQTIAATTPITNSTYSGYITSTTTARTTTLKTITGPTTADIYIYPTTSIYNYWANTVGIKISKPTALTLPSSTSTSSSGTAKATITAGSSVQYLNIPAGYNSTAQYYTISAAEAGGVIDVSSIATLESNLVAANVGKYYRFTGSSGTSSSGTYYISGNIYTYEA